MIRLLHFLTCCVFSLLLPKIIHAQNPADGKLGFTASWSDSLPTYTDTVEIIVKTTLPKGWHLYGSVSDCPEDDGPIRMEIYFDSSLTLVGPLKEFGASMVLEPELWKCSTSEFHGIVELRQKMIVNKPLAQTSFVIKVQACEEKDGRCYMIRETVKLPRLIPVWK